MYLLFCYETIGNVGRKEAIACKMNTIHEKWPQYNSSPPLRHTYPFNYFISTALVAIWERTISSRSSCSVYVTRKPIAKRNII